MKKTNIASKTADTHYLERFSPTWSSDSVRAFNIPSRSIRNTFFYVQEAGYFKTVPPYFTERAGLDSFLIIYTLSGRGILRYMDREFTVEPGDAFYINCQNHHYYECPEQSGWEFLWLHFNGNCALGYFEEFIKSEFSPIRFDDPFFIERTLRRIISLTLKKDVHSELICANLIHNLLTELLIRSSSAGLSLSAMPQYVRNSVKYIDVHFKEAVSLDGLQKEFNISKYHLSREFKKHVGRTINGYLTECRLNCSKELLRFTNLPVSEIAFECGFNNVSHFIGQFRQAEGLTPHAYRKEWNS